MLQSPLPEERVRGEDGEDVADEEEEEDEEAGVARVVLVAAGATTGWGCSLGFGAPPPG